MRSHTDIAFGVEVEAWGFCKKSIRDDDREFEARNSSKQIDTEIALIDITQGIEGIEAIKDEAKKLEYDLTFGSQRTETDVIGTIGTHIHLDLEIFMEQINADQHFLPNVVSYFLKNFAAEISFRYCYSQRLLGRIRWVVNNTLDNEAANIQKLLNHTPNSLEIKVIKYRPDKGSLEICIPDSFDFSEEPKIYTDMANDIRKALFDSALAYVNGETRTSNREELIENLFKIV